MPLGKRKQHSCREIQVCIRTGEGSRYHHHEHGGDNGCPLQCEYKLVSLDTNAVFAFPRALRTSMAGSPQCERRAAPGACTFNRGDDCCDPARHLRAQECFSPAVRHGRGWHVLCMDRDPADPPALSPGTGPGGGGKAPAEAACSSPAHDRRNSGFVGNCRKYILGRRSAVHSSGIRGILARRFVGLFEKSMNFSLKDRIPRMAMSSTKALG